MQSAHSFEGHPMYRGPAPYQQQNSWPGANAWYNRMPVRDPRMHFAMMSGYRQPYPNQGHFMPVEYAPRHFMGEPRMPFDMPPAREDVRMPYPQNAPAAAPAPYGYHMQQEAGAHSMGRFPAPGFHHMNGRVQPDSGQMQQYDVARSSQHQSTYCTMILAELL